MDVAFWPVVVGTGLMTLVCAKVYAGIARAENYRKPTHPALVPVHSDVIRLWERQAS